MTKQIKVRSKQRAVVDENALSVAFVLLARILVEQEIEDGQASAGAPEANRGAITVPAPAASRGNSRFRAYHDEVESLKAAGATNADAIRTVAARYDRHEMTIRSGIYKHKALLAQGVRS